MTSPPRESGAPDPPDAPDVPAALKHLPFGRRVQPRTDFTTWSSFPYELDEPPRLRVLNPPTLPERPRHGESGPADCRTCARPDADFVWTDEHWRLTALAEPSAVPAVVLLEPRVHCDLADLPAELSARLGPMMQRVEAAITGLGGVARVHVNRWGDGGAHLHWWFLGRPAGLAQLRGTFLPLWDDLLPALDEQTWRANLARIGAAMAKGGGTAHTSA